MTDTPLNRLRIYRGNDSLHTVSAWNATAARVTGCALLLTAATGGLVVILALFLLRFNPWLGGLAFITGSGLLIAPLLMWRNIGDYRRVAATFARGALGEDALVRLLYDLPTVDGRTAIYRNVMLPAATPDQPGGDLDAVLVGPGGVYVLEVKRWRGRYLYEDNRWFERRGNAWHESTRNPGQQAFAGAMRLHDYLEARGVRVYVRPRLVWCGPGFVELRGPRTPVWLIGQRERIAQELGSAPPLAAETCRHVEQVLQRLVNRS